MLGKLFNNSVFSDSRGKFERIFDKSIQELEHQNVLQANLSINPQKYTLRGMHYQVSGPEEIKIIVVLAGEVQIVLSNAHLRQQNLELQNEYYILSSRSHQTLLVPSGLATGWLSLSDHAVLLYLMTSRFEECSYGGFCFDDTAASIDWLHRPSIISSKDSNWPPIV
jgi:dTDP-4-dehydrorhamnose 3,5-epimerase